MAGRLLDVDPELAYEHAQAAVRRGGRVDVVREAAGIAAYRTGRFAEALRELRTVRRLNGSSEHLPIMADAERGLGRPERAIALAASPEADTLDAAGALELALVVSGARSDLGEHDAALTVLDRIPPQKGDLALRVLQARAAALDAAGRAEEAAALLADVDPDDLERAAGNAEPDEDVVVYDVYDDEADADETVEAVADEADAADAQAHADSADDEAGADADAVSVADAVGEDDVESVAGATSADDAPVEDPTYADNAVAEEDDSGVHDDPAVHAGATSDEPPEIAEGATQHGDATDERR
jgi:hypothetical protein